MSDELQALAGDLQTRRSRAELWLRVFDLLFVRRGDRGALVCIRLSRHFHNRGWRGTSAWFQRRLRRDFGCFVSARARIGAGLRLPHPNGIVVGEGVVIGERATIYQQVTIGGARRGDWQAGRYPELGDDVTLFSGAKLLGPIRVGSHVTVGANAVVLRDVPPRHTAAGVPASNRPPRGDVASAALPARRNLARG